MEENPDLEILKVRVERLKSQFLAYEEFHDKLAIVQPENEALGEIDDLSSWYYTLAAKINTLNPPPTLTPSKDMNGSPFSAEENTRRVKLRVPELPKFDGDLGYWLSFRNTFVTMVHSCDYYTDLEKFLYLRDFASCCSWQNLDLQCQRLKL